MRRFSAIALALLLALAACGGEGSDDGVSADDETTGSGDESEDGGGAGDSGATGEDGATTPTTTTFPADIAVPVQEGGPLDRVNNASFVCLVLSQYVIGPRGASPDGATAVEADEVLAVTSGGSLTDEGAVEDVLSSNNLQLFDVGTGNSISFVQANAGFAPIQLLATANHWEWAPGADPVAVPELSDPDVDYLEPESSGGDDMVVVIDTEYAATGRAWMDDFVDNIGALTGSPDHPSHGTFVASLIRQVSPSTAVKIVTPNLTEEGAVLVQPELRVDPDAPEPVQELGSTSLPESSALPNELSVLDAILLAKAEYEDTSPLNLSLGTYPCHEPNATQPTALDAPPVQLIDVAIGQWTGPVYAAAGNGAVAYPFYPGALSSTEGVAAVDSSGNLVAWHNGVVGVTNGPPPQATLNAPGVHLIAYGDDQAYAWGGSSFATAIASALVASSDKDYSIDGLVYVGGGTVRSNRP